MSKMQWEEYVIWPGFGDPLPKVGSGMRLVEVKIGRKWVRVRTKGDYASRILMVNWQKIASVRYTGQSMRAVLDAI